MSSAAAATSAPTGQADKTTTSAAPAGDATKPVDKSADTTSVLAPDKSADSKPPADKSKDAQSDKAGELDIKLPEGTQIDEAALKDFKSAAKDMGLNSESASKLVAWYLEKTESATKGYESAWKKQGEDWLAQLKSDKDFGGANFEKNASAAKKAMKFAFGADADSVMADLEARGLSNFPAFVRLASKLGGALAEDSSSTGAGKPGAASDEQSNLRKLYPSMFNADGSPKR